MKSAFRNLQIKPSDWRWLVMMARHPISGNKYYFYDKALPFGHSISYSNFQRVSNAIQWIFKHKTGKKANNYLDDFLFATLLQTYCNQLVEKFLEICSMIKFPVAMEKTVWATQDIIFLGMLLNSVIQCPLKRKIKH